MQEIAFVNFPKTDGEGKMLQITVDGSPVMVFGRRNTDHASLLEDYLSSGNIPFETMKVVSYTVPKPSGDRYAMTGAGFWSIRHKYGILALCGESGIYSIPVDRSYGSYGMPEGWTLRFD
jgi:hypothetical protein